MPCDKQLLWLLFAVTAGVLVALLSPLPKDSTDPPPYNALSQYTGWIYFFCWSVSFWPQIYLNFVRKSTKGLSFDYQLLNFVGFACYAVFNCGLYYSPEIQREYRQTHGGKSAAVRLNDVLFALHAFGATCVTLGQIFWYRETRASTQPTEANDTISDIRLHNPVGLYGLLSPLPPRSTQTSSPSSSSSTPESSTFVQCVRYTTYVVVAIFVLSVAIVCTLAWLKVDASTLTWLNVLYYLSGAKLAITICKYIPQVYENWIRKSTDGWNIWNVLLDFSGGSLSVCQLMIDCGSTNNWSGITGDPVKFLLGFVSILFDVVFMMQHYCIYNNEKNGDRYGSMTDTLLGGRRSGVGNDDNDEWLNLNRDVTTHPPNLYDSWLDNN